MKNFFELKGQTINIIIGLAPDCDGYEFVLDNGQTVSFSHGQDCCESVRVVGLRGDIQNILGYPITLAEEDNPDDDGFMVDHPSYEHRTITKYILESEKGRFEIVWFGDSNGYYGESVDMYVNPTKQS